MKIEHLKQLAGLAIETQDPGLMLRALELMSAWETEEVRQEPPAKPDPFSTMAEAVRNLLAAWRPHAGKALPTSQLDALVVSRLSDEDIKALLPEYCRDEHVAIKGWVFEDGIPRINIGIHTHKIICTHGRGRRFMLKAVMA